MKYLRSHVKPCVRREEEAINHGFISLFIASVLRIGNLYDNYGEQRKRDSAGSMPKLKYRLEKFIKTVNNIALELAFITLNNSPLHPQKCEWAVCGKGSLDTNIISGFPCSSCTDFCLHFI